LKNFYRTSGGKLAAALIAVFLAAEAGAQALDPSALLSELASRGYRLIRFHNIYAMNPGDARPYETVVEVSEVDDALASTWSEVLIEGFGYTDEVTRDAVNRWNHGLRETSGLHAMVGGIDGRIVGSASVFISDSVAVLGGAATLPAWRRRGVQSALISARLALARNSGCDLAVMTADPGSSSGRNAERAGFILVCTHAVLGRDR
jgi:GNAT superfamily N-acetyltransferase